MVDDLPRFSISKKYSGIAGCCCFAFSVIMLLFALSVVEPEEFIWADTLPLRLGNADPGGMSRSLGERRNFV